MIDAFRIADDTLRQGIQGVTDLITIPGLINLDFADIRTVMKDAGTAMMGIGIASGENRALEAAQQATNSSLLEASIAGATRVLFSIAGGPDLTLAEVDEAARTGQIIDERMEDNVRITVIATGFKSQASQSSMDFSNKNLFSSTEPSYAASTSQYNPQAAAKPAATSSYTSQYANTAAAKPAASTPAYGAPTSSYSANANRFADEDYIPDFLRRQR